MSDPIMMPARLDTAAAGALKDDLWTRLAADSAVLLDGRGVEQVGQACLQVLVSARATALGRDLDFRIVDASPTLVDGCGLVGLDHLLAA